MFLAAADEVLGESAPPPASAIAEGGSAGAPGAGSRGSAGASSSSTSSTFSLPFTLAASSDESLFTIDVDGGAGDAAPAAAESDGAEPGAKKLKRAEERRCGTVADRWAERVLKTTIMSDLTDGCPCGCLEGIAYDEVLAARTSRRNEGASGNREFIRAYLEFNPAANKVGFELKTPQGKKLCVVGFDVFNGFAVGYTYRHIRLFKSGARADDTIGYHDSEDTDESMAFRGWWTELRRDTEIMPNVANVKERQLDYIEEGELYLECKTDLIESGSPASAVGSQVCVGGEGAGARAVALTRPTVAELLFAVVCG